MNWAVHNIMSNSPIKLGINARLFPNNWRPALQEIEFAHSVGFEAIQFPGPENGLEEAALGNSFRDVAAALTDTDIAPVMEIIVRLESDSRTTSGRTPLEILQANLPAITRLSCQYVHWHLVPKSPNSIDDYSGFEATFVPEFLQAVELASHAGFVFGIEHNDPDFSLFSDPLQCQRLLEIVTGLSFVWDLNHTTLEHLPEFYKLASRMGMLHISDTLLPEVNDHLPIGLGNIDFAKYFETVIRGGFNGYGILEIGGLPKSGGYGRDTDEALITSKEKLNHVLQRITYAS